MKFVALFAALLLSGCLKPAATVCSTPNACPINFYTCTAANSCNGLPALDLKGPIP
jgi:hypothetical protein